MQPDPILPPYTVAEVAKIFAVEKITVREWCRNGTLRASKPGKSWRIPESEVTRLANAMYGDSDAHANQH